VNFTLWERESGLGGIPSQDYKVSIIDGAPITTQRPIYAASVAVSVSLNLLHHSYNIDRGTYGADSRPGCEATPNGRDRFTSGIYWASHGGTELAEEY